MLKLSKMPSVTSSKGWDERTDSRAQSGHETKAQSFSGPAVLVLEASQHFVPQILQMHTLQVRFTYSKATRTGPFPTTCVRCSPEGWHLAP